MIAKAAPRKGDIPASQAAEQAVVAAALLDCEEVRRVGVFRLLSPRDFWYEPERIVWEAILECVKAGEPVTIPTVACKLAELGTIDRLDSLMGPKSGAEVYLVTVTNDWYAPQGVLAHANIVKDYSRRRAQMDRGARLVREAFEGSTRRVLGWVQL